MRRKIFICFLLFALVSCAETSKETIRVRSVSIIPGTLTLEEGESAQVDVEILPEGTDGIEVLWKSSNTRVATVENGIIIAVSEGNTTITASVGDKSGSCSVTVKPCSIAVSSITLDRESLLLNKGETERLKAIILPDDATDQTIVWSSSNESIAKVSELGDVSALSGGTSIISAEVSGKTASCIVTVNVPLESLSCDVEGGILIDNIDPYQISISYTPSDATINDLEWTIEDNDVLVFASNDGSTSRSVKAVNNGETHIMVSSPSNNISVRIPVEIKVKVTNIEIGLEKWDPYYQDFDWYRIYHYEGTYGEIFTPVVYVEPEIAFVDDGEFEIENEQIATFYGDDGVKLSDCSGETILTASFPYSNLSTSIKIYVKEYLSDAGIKNIQQHEETLMSFGGRIYTNLPSDQFIVNNIMLCDHESRVISSTFTIPEPLTITGNNTNYVAFSTPKINMTREYGINAIIQSEFDPLIEKWYFYITYQRNDGGEVKTAKLFIEPRNWSADYD